MPFILIVEGILAEAVDTVSVSGVMSSGKYSSMSLLRDWSELLPSGNWNQRVLTTEASTADGPGPSDVDFLTASKSVV